MSNLCWVDARACRWVKPIREEFAWLRGLITGSSGWTPPAAAAPEPGSSMDVAVLAPLHGPAVSSALTQLLREYRGWINEQVQTSSMSTFKYVYIQAVSMSICEHGAWKRRAGCPHGLLLVQSNCGRAPHKRKDLVSRYGCSLAWARGVIRLSLCATTYTGMQVKAADTAHVLVLFASAYGNTANLAQVRAHVRMCAVCGVRDSDAHSRSMWVTSSWL